MHNTLIIRNNIASHTDLTQYPDKQLDVKVDLDYYDIKTPIHIKCAIRSFSELELLYCVVAALRKADRYIEKLHFNYLFGMRSDRSFGIGMANYFRDVIAPNINLLIFENNIDQCSILFPHGTLAMKYLPSFTKEYRLYIPAILHLTENINPIVIFGDKTAAIKWDVYVDVFGCHPERIYYFDKVRKEYTDIVRIYPELKKDFIGKINDALIANPLRPILIFDDMCDGGATFIRESEYLKEHFPNQQRILFVCHGLFSQGFEVIAKHFDKVITTNSYQDFYHEQDEYPDKLQLIDVWGND